MSETITTSYRRETPVMASRIAARRSGLYIETSSGKFLIPWEECSPRLAAAKQSERLHIEVSPMGIGVHWPLLDEDLAVGPLVKGRNPA